jgi:hypothetical protein
VPGHVERKDAAGCCERYVDELRLVGGRIDHDEFGCALDPLPAVARAVGE